MQDCFRSNWGISNFMLIFDRATFYMKSLKHLNKYFYKYRFRLLLGIAFVIMSNLFSAFPAKSASSAVDLLAQYLKQLPTLQGEQLDIASKTFQWQLIKLLGLIIFYTLIRGFFMYLMRQAIIVMSRLIEYDLKNEVYQHYQMLTISFYRKNNTGDLMARISEDVSRVRMYIGPAIMYYTNLVATFIVVIPIMFSVHRQLAFYVLLPLPILSYAIFYVNNIINRKSDAIQNQLSNITNFVQETFSGIRVIKAFAAEKAFRQLFIHEAEAYKDKNMDLAKVDATFFPLMVFLTGLSTIITVFLGGLFVIKGEITLGNILEFVIYVNLLTWPVASLGWTTSLVQRAAASQERLNQFLQTTPEINQQIGEPFIFNNRIDFVDVGYTYPGKTTPALSHINLSIKKGKTLAILGTTGSGKSTLVQLLLRMFDVTHGEVLIDGRNIKDVNLFDFKNQLGYVPQEVFLFSDTIHNNIAFGLKKNTDTARELVVQSSIHAALHNNIMEFSQGYDTVIGERGVTLSGGQKQRVSIARALINNPEILILDDCLSAVDTKTESEILTHFKTLSSQKTSIIISHRVSTVKDADHIILLDNGQIIEEGTHQQLFAMNKRYAEMYQTQISNERA